MTCKYQKGDVYKRQSLLAGQNLSVTDEGDKVIVHGNGFEIPFDKETGLIVNATVGGEGKPDTPGRRLQSYNPPRTTPEY